MTWHLGGRSRGDFDLLRPRVQLGKTVHYLPILFIDQLSNRVKDLMVSTGPRSCGDGSCAVYSGEAWVPW